MSRTDNTICTQLIADGESRAQYPFEFTLDHTITAVEGGVQLELSIQNDDRIDLPVSPGWHPYFRCPNGSKLALLRQITSEPRIDSAAGFDFAVRAPKAGRVSFDIPDIGHISLSFSLEMRTLQLWSEDNKDFICIEPFLAPPNTINTAKRTVIVAGERRAFWMRIELCK